MGSDDVSIIEEKRGNGLTSPLQLGVSTGLAGQGEQEAQKQVRQDRSSKRRQPKTTIAMVDLTMTEQSARVETNRADPVTNTSEVVDLTKVDLTTSEVDLDINAPLNNTLLCSVCLDPLFELDVERDALSTPCGHLICSACLPRALHANGRCPKCRKETLLQDAIKIHL